MSFMDSFKKNIAKKPDIDVGTLEEPTYYLHTGSYTLNKLMSGTFQGGIPQGRLVAFGGHSSSGKSLVGVSILSEVLKQGGYALAVDSEGALDRGYLEAVGIDADNPNFESVRVATISKCGAVVNAFIQHYKNSNETKPAVVLVDSLDQLFTDSEQDAIDKTGILGGDQGQQAKQLKRMLKSWVLSTAKLPLTIICTKQVYKEQDKFRAYEEPWVFTEAIKFPFSQIIMVEKLQFKDDKVGHKGFTMKARSYKNRMAREKQVVKVEVPYDSGFDAYAGLLEIALQYGIVTQAGAWYSFNGEKYQGKAPLESNKALMHDILQKIIEVDSKEREVHAELDEYISEAENPDVSKETARSKKLKRILEENMDEVE